MKKMVAITVAAAFLAVSPFPAAAGDAEWATAGKILTGIIGVTILGNAIAGAHYHPAPVYAPPPRVYYPPEEVWVPGRYETRIERRWVPGHWEIERRGPGYGDDYERRYRGNGNHRGRSIWVPGYYRDVEVTVWIPGRWEVRG
ncbi:MAG TPA: hypothetical protein DEH27_03005 [Deltaproteobacteria bacterium]|nr:hypothetical protein [Deltaproteobacteria bacterium]